MSSKKANSRPPRIAGLRHVALRVRDLSACQHFYVDLLGYQIEWQPDEANVYLSSGVDNLALHYNDAHASAPSPSDRLDHIGIILARIEDVDVWYQWLLQHQVRMKTAPKTHRDGARSFYCYDPEGNTVQMIYHPPIAQIADQ